MAIISGSEFKTIKPPIIEIVKTKTKITLVSNNLSYFLWYNQFNIIAAKVTERPRKANLETVVKMRIKLTVLKHK